MSCYQFQLKLIVTVVHTILVIQYIWHVDIINVNLFISIPFYI